MISQYPELQSDLSIQGGIYRNAISRAIEDTQKLPDGEKRIVAINKVYIERTLTIEGVSLQLGYSDSTVRKWLQQFVNAVGRNAGF